MRSAPFPRGPDEITIDWLADAVGAPVSSFELEQIGMGLGLLSRLYRLTLTGDGGLPSSVVVKIPTFDEGARRNIVEPMGFYEREVLFYQEAADAVPVATPRLYFAEFDSATGDFALVFEDCSDRRMVEQTAGCPIPDANAAVDALAALHSHSWAGSRFSAYPWLPSYAAAPFPQVLSEIFRQSWPRALEIVGERIPKHIRHFGDRYVGLIQWFMGESAAEPLTFCHGDFRLDNLFFRTKEEHVPVTIVDWQICFRGRGGFDLAYFISQSLTVEDRRAHEKRLIERYARGLAARGIDYPRDELLRDYRRTVAWCFIYPIVATGLISMANERQLHLVHGMLDRSIAAIEDTRALEVLP